MDIKSFDYYLPPGYIAQEPLTKRDNSKLMIIDKKTGFLQHKRFYQIDDFLHSGDLLVLNNSKVIPVRLYGNKKNTGGKIETLLINKLADNHWKALLKPGKRIHIGTEIIFSPELNGEIVEKNDNEGSYIIKMNARDNFNKILHKIGIVPTPPYIKKKLDNSDLYQTVYASTEGSIAAPTAGFHFTKELLNKIKSKGVEILFLTLHIGRGTFEMINEEKIEDHIMKSELYTITDRNAKILNQAIKTNRRIIGVGTSVTRALESSISIKDSIIREGTRWTDLYIYPGFKYRIIKVLLTNFHLPRSTPLMLASAFAGKELLLNAYREAIKQNYRFYSFGDSMLIF
ncbi:MAG: tRNA preQ1(34) S-adenosylmethionine ribosyltransferase-isomerase QueA [Atribacterota bacterium]|nr:tRNA preQ1(34) S-adenosylmethionine ribosyltransferase-isomerase QueA [Atribacterota bacterium]